MKWTKMKIIVGRYKKEYEWEILMDFFSKPSIFILKNVQDLYSRQIIHHATDTNVLKMIFLLGDTTIKLLHPYRMSKEISHEDKIQFLSLSHRYMMKIRTKIKILYYQNIQNPMEYHISNGLLQIMRFLEKCITFMNYHKSFVFLFLEKKIGEDVKNSVYDYLI